MNKTYHLLRRLFCGNKEKTIIIKKRLVAAEFRANRKNLVFDLTFDDVLDILAKQNGRCYLTNEPLTFKKKDKNVISFDRDNPPLDYTKKNLNLVTAQVNKCKSDNPTPEFLDLCGKVHNNRHNIKPKNL